MPEVKVYRTYRFRDKDPVIDEMRTLVQKDGLMKRLGMLSTLSGVSESTLDNWFNGETKKPQNYTICAVTSALGYKREWVRDGALDLEHELQIAKAWNKRHERDQAGVPAAKKKKKTNGHARPNGREHRAGAH